MEADANEDLGWLAFRYISNEMTQAEIEAFEQKLTEDQSAREAVAQAVTWTQAVALNRSEALPARRAISVPRMRWFAAAAASIAASVMVFHSVRNSWELRTLARSFAEHMGPDTFRVVDAESLGDSDDSMSGDDDSDLTVPSWMIEAVVGTSGADKRGGI
jgi:hypothetical protein